MKKHYRKIYVRLQRNYFTTKELRPKPRQRTSSSGLLLVFIINQIGVQRTKSFGGARGGASLNLLLKRLLNRFFEIGDCGDEALLEADARLPVEKFSDFVDVGAALFGIV